MEAKPLERKFLVQELRWSWSTLVLLRSKGKVEKSDPFHVGKDFMKRSHPAHFCIIKALMFNPGTDNTDEFLSVCSLHYLIILHTFSPTQ